MYGENQSEMQCAEFEARLADGLDETLPGAEREAFASHRSACLHCAMLYAEAEAGLRWLAALKQEEVEPPARLMDRILNATSRAQLPERKARQTWWQRLRETPALAPVFATVLQPRFAVAFAMTFFSISVLLELGGVKLRDLRYVDLRPSALVQSAYEAQGKLIKYYENIRFVYEFETRMRELKRATSGDEPKPQPEQPRNPKRDTTGQPDPEKYRNYSQEEMRRLWARADQAAPMAVAGLVSFPHPSASLRSASGGRCGAPAGSEEVRRSL